MSCEATTNYYRSACAAVRLSLIRSMDMPTLLVWRITSRRNYEDVCDELRNSLNTLLLDFVPSPTDLLKLLTRTRALLSGELALCYILRDASIIALSLEIYVGSVWFDTFIDEFGDSPALSGYQVDWSMTHHAERRITSRFITHSLNVFLSNGNSITIHAVSSPSACHAIACSPTSLGITFITEFSFATAYPRLTFDRRAIVCWDVLAEGDDSELRMYEQLDACGYTFEEDPTVWPEYSTETRYGSHTTPVDCVRPLHLCPQQSRYFGDAGSMVCFMDTLSVDVAWLKDRCVPPYGIMAVWRLQSNVLCDARCDEFDDLLAPGITVTSIMFETESFKTAIALCPSTEKGLYASAQSSLSGRARSVTM